MSAEETVLNLFETYWFEQRAFAPKTAPFFPQEKSQESAAAVEPNLNRITTLMRKSYSDHNLGSELDLASSPSPTSVLGPHLQTILSGKEVESFDESSAPELEHIKIGETKLDPKSDKVRERRRGRRKSGASRSLSELEVEELKGFMDLGFVFSDEDKDSRLVSIIPGLQRLGKESESVIGGFDETTASASVSRPYLSEAWDRMEEEERLVKNPLMDWRIPAFDNEMELKDHLKFWAHSVASTVR
ncbi:uncharacterized protein LOC131009962 [Salvia miltiorrhiza]|uniref:uncharacterized protein LOC131009962 n=1 Tax=Salvia miltiorrhiza TaxID=226208 RepID=UPI0025AD6D70|nr:uncharacterized protein LOC131009962 [Salvia miltiorrhiza]